MSSLPSLLSRLTRYSVKLPKPGVGTNFVVHKYFYEHSPLWRRLHAEEQDPVLGIISDDSQSDNADDSDEEHFGAKPVKFRTTGDSSLYDTSLFVCLSSGLDLDF